MSIDTDCACRCCGGTRARWMQCPFCWKLCSKPRFCVDSLVEYDPSRLTAQVRRAGRRWCHLTTDDFTPDGLERLHKFALSVGMRREWFQDKHRGTSLWAPHYDLVDSRRARAVHLGAVEVDRRELLHWLERGREAYRDWDNFKRAEQHRQDQADYNRANHGDYERSL